MSWVLPLVGCGGPAVSRCGHETRRHRVRGPFPMGACLLFAGTLALAGCGSSSNSTASSSSSTVTIIETTPNPPPPTDTLTGDGDSDTDSGDTSTTGDDGQTSTQQQQQPPEQELEPEPEPQTGGGGGSSPQPQPQPQPGPEPQPVTQQPTQQPSNQPPPQTGGGSGGGQGGGGSQTSQTSNSSSPLGISADDLQTLISNYTPNINLNLPTGFSIESSPTSKDSDTVYDRQFDILKSGNELSYEVKSLPKCLAASRPDGFCLGTPLHDKDWSGRLYKDGKSLGVIYSNLPKKYPLNTWAIFFSPGGVGQHENLVLDSASGKLSWKTGSASTSPLSALNIPGFTPDQYGSISVSQGNHPGTFYSVPGTFSCASECILSLDSLGGEEFFFTGGGAFSFTPNDSATATIPAQHIETKIPPHVHFGYWLTAPENDGESWSIEPFSLANFYGEPEDYIPNLNNLQGSASYSGPATGIYTIPDHPMGGSTGQFRARVTLRANWDTLQDPWTITGSVDGFNSLSNEDHGRYIRDWSLDLGKASVVIEIPQAGTHKEKLNEGFRNGVTTGSGPDSQTGSWTGRFWGKDSTAPGNRKNEPMAVTGEFTGHFGSKIKKDEAKPHAPGSVVGSFVAGKE